MNKKNKKSSNKERTTSELLAGEIFYETTSAAMADLAAFEAATNWLSAAKGMRADYLAQLEKKKSGLKNMEEIDGGTGKTSIELEAIILEIDKNILPAAEVALEDARQKIYDVLQATILKTKEKYLLQWEKHFSEATDIVFSLAYQRPVAVKLN
jgi:hypothetical protein